MQNIPFLHPPLEQISCSREPFSPSESTDPGRAALQGSHATELFSVHCFRNASVQVAFWKCIELCFGVGWCEVLRANTAVVVGCLTLYEGCKSRGRGSKWCKRLKEARIVLLITEDLNGVLTLRKLLLSVCFSIYIWLVCRRNRRKCSLGKGEWAVEQCVGL